MNNFELSIAKIVLDFPEKYQDLKNKGITHYSAQFNGERMRNLLNIVGQNIQDITIKFLIAPVGKLDPEGFLS